MPLLGHAFTGMATACIVSTSSKTNTSKSDNYFSPFLSSTLIALAYLPDIVSQVLLLLNWHNGRTFGHSLLFAVIAAIPAGILLCRQTPFTLKQSVALGFSSILLHDILDILQSTDRQPFWPFSTATVGTDFSYIPTNPTKEALIFASIYCLILGYYFLRHKRVPLPPQTSKPYSTTQVWIGRLLIFSIVLSAVATHHLRSQRLREFQQTRPYLKQHKYKELFQTLDTVDKWPKITHAGRTDYFRGEAYLQQHKLDLAETYFLKSYAQDNNFFWCVANLALTYALSDRTQEKRVTLSAPYLFQLQTQFSRHREYPNYMRKIQHNLSTRQ